MSRTLFLKTCLRSEEDKKTHTCLVTYTTDELVTPLQLIQCISPLFWINMKRFSYDGYTFYSIKDPWYCNQDVSRQVEYVTFFDYE